MLQALPSMYGRQSVAVRTPSILKLAILFLLLSLTLPFVSNADEPGTSATQPTESAVDPVLSLSPTEQALFYRINAIRAEHGLAPYALNLTLTQVARAHTADMAGRKWMSHWGSDGSGYRDRIAWSGLAFGNATENVGYGFNLDRMVTWWMNSPVHRAAILGTKYNQIGLGHIGNPNARYGHWWTINFIGPPR